MPPNSNYHLKNQPPLSSINDDVVYRKSRVELTPRLVRQIGEHRDPWPHRHYTVPPHAKSRTVGAL